MVEAIKSKRSNYFRWHDSGDVQDKEHLFKIFAVCKLTPNVKHWMPTPEAWVKTFLKLKPGNLVIRFNIPMVDQDWKPFQKSWPTLSTVISKDQPWFGATSKSAQLQHKTTNAKTVEVVGTLPLKTLAMGSTKKIGSRIIFLWICLDSKAPSVKLQAPSSERNKQQASSPEAQASSVKPEVTSSRICDP